MVLPAGKKTMARQDEVGLQFAARAAFCVMRDCRTALGADAVEAALDRLGHARFQGVEQAVGPRVPIPARKGTSFPAARWPVSRLRSESIAALGRLLVVWELAFP
jgi:hypothetical protein